MIFSWKIHGIQKEGTCHVWLFQYSSAQPSMSCISDIACKLGSIAKYENPMKNWLIIQLMKLLHVLLHKSVCSSNSPLIRPFICPMECPPVRLSVRLSVRPSVCPSVCPSHIQIHGKLWITPMLHCYALSRRMCFHRWLCSWTVVTLIGCGAKSSERHWMWGMNVNSSDNWAEITTKGQG